MKRILLFFAVSIFFAGQLFSQERIVRGVVTVLDSIPVYNAEVLVKSTQEVVYTDSVGIFEVVCSEKDKLKVSGEGLRKRNVRLDDKVSLVFVNLRFNPNSYTNKLVSIGYENIIDEDNIYSVSTLDNDDVDFSAYSSVYDLILGRFSGVKVTNDNRIVIRGEKSLVTNTEALIIIDGVQSNSTVLQSISPSDVESIEILKDAAAAIYGSKGAHGVVVVSTW